MVYVRIYKPGQRDRRKELYGLSKVDFITLLEKQNNKCAVCLTDLRDQKQCVDHCHVTHRVRGILCVKCNTGIGMMCDNVNLLKLAIKYLSKMV